MKRILALLILSFMIISFVAPFFGASNKKQTTDVAAQDISTDYQMYAGIAQILHEYHKKINNTNKNNTVTQVESFSGWTTSNVNVRKEPDINSEIISVIKFNTYIDCYYIENELWVKIEYNGSEAYICKEYISDTECRYVEHTIPENNGFKSYMPYTAITDISSKQYQLQTQHAYTGTYGIRQVDGRYCVAIGTAFDVNIGTYFDLVLENGYVIPCIVGDIKDNAHTKPDNITTKANGCVSEFIIDTDSFDSYVLKIGDLSAINKEWDSKVVTMRFYNINILEK